MPHMSKQSQHAVSALHPPTPLCKHVDHLVDDLRVHVPAALNDFDPDAIHKARVATRRLKAALDLLKTCISPAHAGPFMKIGRKLRRRLGPLRDIDVMIEHLDEVGKGASFEPGARWLRDRLLEDRSTARTKASQQVPPASALARLGTWWGLRQDVIDADPAVTSLLGESLHLQLDRFVEHADQMVQATSSRPVESSLKLRDPHELRIAGKALRYTLELAQAQGHTLPPDLLKTFKHMQERLGAWHDYIVLGQRSMEASLDADLPLHDPSIQRHVLMLADFAITRAQRELEEFGKLWAERGGALSKTIRDTFPLTRSVDIPQPNVTAPKTDPDPSGSPTPPVPQAVSTTPPPVA